MLSRTEKKQLFSKHVCNGIFVSVLSGLSLSEYVRARSAYCSSAHVSPCNKCDAMLMVATMVLNKVTVVSQNPLSWYHLESSTQQSVLGENSYKCLSSPFVLEIP